MVFIPSDHPWGKQRFGLERECLRVTAAGELAFTPHPAAFGNKLYHPYLTTDFSESQMEMITPVCDTLSGMTAFLRELYDYAVRGIGGEYLWPASMPCVLPAGKEIPVAVYEGEGGKAATDYRRRLLARYGGQRQLISGIHFNFSFTEDSMRLLQRSAGNQESLSAFSDQVYLKIARSYLYHSWLVTYWFGCANVVDASYDPACVQALSRREDGSAVLPGGLSLRASRWGYQNTVPLYPDYTSAAAYVKSVYGFVRKGALQEPKELYASVRLKPFDTSFDSLATKGIGYLEFRNLDIDPYTPLGVDPKAMEFFYLFLLYLLEWEENMPAGWQQEGKENVERMAMEGLMPSVRLRRNGQPVSPAAWEEQVCGEMSRLAKRLKLPFSPPRPTRLAERMLAQPYVGEMMALAKRYKAESTSKNGGLRKQIEQAAKSRG